MHTSDPATIRVPHPFQRSHRWKGWGIGASRPSQHAHPRPSSKWSRILLPFAALLIFSTTARAQSPTLTYDPAGRRIKAEARPGSIMYVGTCPRGDLNPHALLGH